MSLNYPDLVHRLSQSRHSGNLILNTKQRVAPAHGESFVWIGALAKSERKDALVPDPQEYDMIDPDQSGIRPLSAKSRLDLFSRLARCEAV